MVLIGRCLVDLPDDIIYLLLKFCDVVTLGRLAQVCRRLSALVSQDYVWLSLKCRLTCIFGSSSSEWFVMLSTVVYVINVLSLLCRKSMHQSTMFGIFIFVRDAI